MTSTHRFTQRSRFDSARRRGAALALALGCLVAGACEIISGLTAFETGDATSTSAGGSTSSSSTSPSSSTTSSSSSSGGSMTCPSGSVCGADAEVGSPCNTGDSGTCNGQCSCYVFGQTFSTDFGVPRAMVLSRTGDVYIGGYYTGQMTFDDQTFDSTFRNQYFVLKVPIGGEAIANAGKSAAPGQAAVIVGMALAPGNGDVFAVGNALEEVNFGDTTLTHDQELGFLARFGGGLGFAGAALVGDPRYDEPTAVVVTQGGPPQIAWVAGNRWGGLFDKQGDADIFLQKHTIDGGTFNPGEVFTIDAPEPERHQRTHALFHIGAAVYLAGVTHGPVTFPTANGGGVVGNDGERSIFVAQFDGAAEGGASQLFNHAKTLASVPESATVDLGHATTDGERIYATGVFTGTMKTPKGDLVAKSGAARMFLLVADKEGVVQTAKAYGDDATSSTYSGEWLAPLDSGGVLLAGRADGDIDFGRGSLPGKASDVVLGLFDQAGTNQWAGRFGDALPNALELAQRRVMAVRDPDRRITVSGSFTGSLDFGGGSEPPLTPGNAASPGFLVRLLGP